MARIMIVDDSLIARRMLRGVLSEIGHEIVCEAGDGVSAIDLFRRLQPDLVTMDINMPKLDGLLASGQIHDEFPNARIVIVSSISATDQVNQAIRTGALGYLLKPFRKEKVAEMLDLALRNK